MYMYDNKNNKKQKNKIYWKESNKREEGLFNKVQAKWLCLWSVCNND